ncbi:uncharacterized protein M6B38_267790 [Iris pallida]|uniref:Peptidylprolyl isomerase n=1 Tax=Iris pallida TaxID=29817 RepID=A0AAX6I981_IRIPA|nr:uncharacterized protein M6B38_267790 [Iris pallida]
MRTPIATTTMPDQDETGVSIDICKYRVSQGAQEIFKLLPHTFVDACKLPELVGQLEVGQVKLSCGDLNSALHFAFIEFTDEDDISEGALSLPGTEIGYYPIRVLPSKIVILKLVQHSCQGVLGGILIVARLYSVLWGKYKENKEKEAMALPSSKMYGNYITLVVYVCGWTSVGRLWLDVCWKFVVYEHYTVC